MNDKEYTYDIGKYTIGVDTNGEDGIGMTVAIIKNGEINFLGNCYGENARCIDLLIKENRELKKKYENAVADYETTMFEKEQLNSLVNSCQEEIRELKKQLEELKSTNKVLSEELTKDKILKQDCLTTCCGIPIGDIPKLINQQKKFIEYLEYQVKLQEELNDIHLATGFEEILSKYKEIIGDDK